MLRSPNERSLTWSHMIAQRDRKGLKEVFECKMRFKCKNSVFVKLALMPQALFFYCNIEKDAPGREDQF